tara:strand:+ start:52 stop:432 length:381 start_codon:yes stop_codon:yes gene_type:complete
MDQDNIKEIKEQIGFAFDYVEFSALAEASLKTNDYDLCIEYSDREFAAWNLVANQTNEAEAMLKKIESDFGDYVASVIADNAGVTWFDIGGKDFDLDDLSGTIREAHYHSMILNSYDLAAEIAEDK